MDSAPSLDRELALRAQGYRVIAGLDEVGRGAWAGPLVASAVIFPIDSASLPEQLSGIRDSKHLTPLRRVGFAERIRELALGVGLGMVSPARVDEMGVAAATRLAMKRALDGLPVTPEYLLIDGFPLGYRDLPEEAIIRGDLECTSIAASSVVAKVARDSMMVTLDGVYRGYGFGENKGYGTAAHRDLVDQKGPCAIHRLSFSPMNLMVNQGPGSGPEGAQVRSRAALGKLGERLAAEYLEEQGYVICETNYRCSAGELDIVALDQGCLVFVEVRTRRSGRFGTPAESITRAKKKKLVEVAETYLQEHETSDLAWRIDAALVRVSGRSEVQDLTVIRNAIEA
jgi:ribonuclease HII